MKKLMIMLAVLTMGMVSAQFNQYQFDHEGITYSHYFVGDRNDADISYHRYSNLAFIDFFAESSGGVLTISSQVGIGIEVSDRNWIMVGDIQNQLRDLLSSDYDKVYLGTNIQDRTLFDFSALASSQVQDGLYIIEAALGVTRRGTVLATPEQHASGFNLSYGRGLSVVDGIASYYSQETGAWIAEDYNEPILYVAGEYPTIEVTTDFQGQLSRFRIRKVTTFPN